MRRLKKYFNNLSTRKIAIIFFFVSFLLYFNSLFNGFVGDDVSQIQKNVLLHTFNPFAFFNSGSFAEGYVNNYYKPVFSIVLSFIYVFGFGNPFGFHLIQVLLHATNALLIFLIFRFFFKKEISFISSLIFLVHPINTEAVAYISALQETLFLFFGLSALYLTIKKSNKIYLPYLIGFLLLASLLSKETGITFLFIVPFFAYLFQKRKILTQVIPSLLAFLIYIFLRFFIAHVYFNKLNVAPIMMLSFPERMISIPRIIFFYLKTFFFPKDLLIYQTWKVKSVSSSDFYFPLIFDVIFFVALVVVGFLIRKRCSGHFKTFVFFLTWFLLGLGIHLQIFPLDQTVAERWFYLPMVGLLGILGTLFISLRNKSLTKIFPLILAVISLLFFARTVARNVDWKSGKTLCNHDIKLNRESYQLENCLGVEEANEKKFDESELHYLRSAELFPSSTTFTSLGYFYLLKHDAESAKKSFYKAIDLGDIPPTYIPLGGILISENPKVARALLEEGVKKFPNYALLWKLLAVAKYKLGDGDGAMEAIQKANSVSPSDDNQLIINAFENHQQINIQQY